MEDGKPVEREDGEDEAGGEEEEGEVYHRQEQSEEATEEAEVEREGCDGADEKEGGEGVEEISVEVEGERQEATPPVEEPDESNELSSQQVRNFRY